MPKKVKKVKKTLNSRTPPQGDPKLFGFKKPMSEAAWMGLPQSARTRFSRTSPTGKTFRLDQRVGGGVVSGFNPNGSPIISMTSPAGQARTRVRVSKGPNPKTALPKRSGPPKRRGMRNRPY